MAAQWLYEKIRELPGAVKAHSLARPGEVPG